MRDHYDPRYEKHRARHEENERGTIPVARLTGDGLDAAAAAVEAAVEGLALPGNKAAGPAGPQP